MIEHSLNYRPRVVSPPGETLSDLLQEREITQVELARRMGRPPNAINEIVLGNKEITEDSALELERVLGTPAHFWLAREAKYREFLARERDAKKADGRIQWLDQLPLKALQSIGELPNGRLTASFKASLVEPALRFFGVASPEGWENQYQRVQVAFRRSNPKEQTNNAAITAWLRLGEVQASKMRLAPYSAEKLQASIADMRALSTQNASAIHSGLTQLCADAGIVLLCIPPIAGTHVSGVARWLGDRPVIQLSLLGKWNDRFWFSFFHEVAHILKHPKKAVFLDDASAGHATALPDEIEADRFASETLINAAQERQLGQISHASQSIVQFAQHIGIHPGIVVGRLQHMGLLPQASALNALKDRYSLSAADSKT